MVEWRNLRVEWRNFIVEWGNLRVEWRNLRIEWRNLIVEWRNLIVEWRNLIVEWRNLKLSGGIGESWKGGMTQQSGVFCTSGPPYISQATPPPPDRFLIAFLTPFCLSDNLTHQTNGKRLNSIMIFSPR